MKITKTQLRQIIKEESAKVLNEYQFYPGTEDDMAAMKNQEREDSRKARLASDESRLRHLIDPRNRYQQRNAKSAWQYIKGKERTESDKKWFLDKGVQ